MTLHTLSTSFQYPAPDLNKIQKSREELNYKIRTLSTIYLPVLGEELNALQMEINSTDEQTLKAITQVPAALQTSEIQRFHTVIEKLQHETPTPEQQEAIDSYYGEIKLLIEAGTSETLKFATGLNNNLANLKATTLSDNQYRINELDVSINNITPRLAEEKLAIEKLVKNETELNEAIKVIEATDTFTLIKELFLTTEKLSALNLSAPQLELVKAGIAAAGKVLGLISDAIKYDNLIEARRQIQTQLDDRRKSSSLIDKNIETLQDRKKQLTEFQAIKTPREDYTREMSIIAESINKFLELTRHDASDELKSVVKQFIEQSNVFIKHLDNLRKEWRS
ncbi:alpha-xenorhabdolysin family binary toxin subunit B [Pseudomonas sp. Irchel s3b6]|uniref:alpha-xenorhabdolysin family binary toxin subunit B n=1 Tax=Pseudomonas sp. Irchel s3b6 TaxID=2009078 RepID=UPI000BA304F6|nr:alpha-xenorhabdolysin family binary toxin subunit B [Pseudomonas sp. Irchel s3b6]